MSRTFAFDHMDEIHLRLSDAADARRAIAASRASLVGERLTRYFAQAEQSRQRLLVRLFKNLSGQ
jgi:hypothetical protein